MLVLMTKTLDCEKKIVMTMMVTWSELTTLRQCFLMNKARTVLMDEEE